MLLSGCRSKLETSRDHSRQLTEEIGVVLRKADSISSTIAEKQHIKIEFYPPDNSLYHNLSSESDCVSQPCKAPASSGVPNLSGDIGLGQVKSIEITNERNTSSSSASQTDSTAVSKTEEADETHKDTHTEARQDNGTVATVSIVAALLVLALAWLFIKKILKK